MENGAWAIISTARAAIAARVFVTNRIKPLKMGKHTFQQIGLPYHWGGSGLVRGDSTNDLLAFSADSNTSIMNSQAHTANIEPGRRARGADSDRFYDGPRLPADELRDRAVVGNNRLVGKHLVSSAEDKPGDQT